MRYLYITLVALIAMSCGGNAQQDSNPQPSTQDTVAQSFVGQYKSTGDPSLLNVALPQGMDNHTVRYDHMTVYFNPKQRIPNCVAYELTRTQVSMADAPDAERRDKYQFNRDKSVDGCPDWWEYKNTGYTRGHMAPAMDMRWDKKAMEQCFLMTNMCPQVEEMNGGKWRHLEEAVHHWARKTERLVIFTGPILSKNMKKIGKRHDIAVPGRFYKVIYSPQTRRAIAFVMDNRALEKSWTRYATTIDQVEELTGIDFLASLDDQVESTIESNYNIKDWPNYTPRR